MDVNKILSLALVQTIIDEINKNCTDTMSHEDRYDFLDDLCEVNDDGETKTVLLHRDWDFVIKIPNYCRYKRNYCELEVKNYQSAKQYRVEKVLLETAVLTSLPCGITLYVQPRYDCENLVYQRKHGKLTYKMNNYQGMHRYGKAASPSKKALEGMYESHRINTFWFSRLVQLYGKKFARSLEQWSQENQVGDLHNGNVGWLKDRPIILDYAGYFG